MSNFSVWLFGFVCGSTFLLFCMLLSPCIDVICGPLETNGVQETEILDTCKNTNENCVEGIINLSVNMTEEDITEVYLEGYK